MLEPLLGSKGRERVLVFLRARKEGYAREIARFFDTDLVQVQKQLDRLEFGGVLAGRAAWTYQAIHFQSTLSLLD